MATISFHVGTTTSISHNNRHHVSGNLDINLERTKDNIYYVQRDIREVYSENFDQAVQDYNNKQKRSDRKIDDYYTKILQDKKTHHQRELIVAICCGVTKCVLGCVSCHSPTLGFLPNTLPNGYN